MPKEKRKEVREKFKNTKAGRSANILLNRLFIEGLLCVVMGIAMLIYSIIDKMEWHYYGLSIVLMIAGTVFLFGQWFIRYAKYDKFIKEMAKKAK
jgi:hypothetical protein